MVSAFSFLLSLYYTLQFFSNNGKKKPYLKTGMRGPGESSLRGGFLKS